MLAGGGADAGPSSLRPRRGREFNTTRLQTSQSASQLFHGPAPRSPLHRLSVRFRRSRSNTSTEYSLPAPGGYSNYRLQTGTVQDWYCIWHLLAGSTPCDDISGCNERAAQLGMHAVHSRLLYDFVALFRALVAEGGNDGV